MSSLKIWYLFKRRYITYESKKYEIFEFVDYIFGIGFTNINNKDVCNVINGNNISIYASRMNENANESEFWN